MLLCASHHHGDRSSSHRAYARENHRGDSCRENRHDGGIQGAHLCPCILARRPTYLGRLICFRRSVALGVSVNVLACSYRLVALHDLLIVSDFACINLDSSF